MEKEEIEKELKEMQTISNEFRKVSFQLSYEYLRQSSYVRSAISFHENDELKMLSCEIPKKFYHFCVEFKPFFFAEKFRYLRYDNVGNKLDMVQFYLKHCDPLNFVQGENVNRIVEVMRKTKENEQPYYNIKYIFSDNILFFMYNLNNLV